MDNLKWINGAVYYSQKEDKYKKVPYAGSDMHTSGCGPSSFAMVLSTMLKKEILPEEISEFSEKHGHVAEELGTLWTLFEHGARQYGIKGGDALEPTKENIEKAKNVLKNKKGLAILSLNNNLNKYWTRAGHLVAWVGLTKDGKILINDPAKIERTLKKYTDDEVFPACTRIFVFTYD